MAEIGGKNLVKSDTFSVHRKTIKKTHFESLLTTIISNFVFCDCKDTVYSHKFNSLSHSKITANSKEDKEV